MILTFKIQTEVPTEIILLIFDHVPKADLKSLSFVSTEFARITRLLLFRSITVSAQQSDINRFLNIIRRPQLCCVVEHLIWQELPFRNRGSASPEKILLEWPTSILSQHLATRASDILSSGELDSEDQAEQPSLEEQEVDLIDRICSFSEHKDCAVAGIEMCLAVLIEGIEAYVTEISKCSS